MKNLLFTFLLTFVAGSSLAQFHLGLSAGANYSFWKWDIKSINHELALAPAMGWRAAALGEWRFSPALALRAELGTQVKANKIARNPVFETDLLSGNPEGTRWMFRQYYQFWGGSLLAQFSPMKKYRPLYLMGGVTVEKVRNGWAIINGSENGVDRSSKQSIEIRKTDWSENSFITDFGLGGNIPLRARSVIRVESRFQYNLFSLSKSDEVDARVHTLLFNVAYLYRL